MNAQPLSAPADASAPSGHDTEAAPGSKTADSTTATATASSSDEATRLREAGTGAMKGNKKIFYDDREVYGM